MERQSAAQWAPRMTLPVTKIEIHGPILTMNLALTAVRTSVSPGRRRPSTVK
jgi:hypothetical protein